MIERDFIFTPGVLKFINSGYILFLAEVLLDWVAKISEGFYK